MSSCACKQPTAGVARELVTLLQVFYPLIAARHAPSAIDEEKEAESNAPAAAPLATVQQRLNPYSSTMLLNPPQNMRMPSNGIFAGSIMSASRLSFITFAMTRSRCLRDL